MSVRRKKFRPYGPTEGRGEGRAPGAEEKRGEQFGFFWVFSQLESHSHCATMTID